MNKTCKRCGYTAPEEWFVKTCFTNKTSGKITPTRRATCPMCEQEERDKRKWANRWMVKAHNAVYNHAKKYGMAPSQFISQYGWDIPLVAHKLKHAYENTCAYCHNSFVDMGHGLRDITLDIIHRDELPYLTTNVQAICQTCNSSKGKRLPSDYGLHLQMVRKRQEFLKVKPNQLVLNI